MPKGTILGVQVDVIDKEGLHDAICQSIRAGRKDVYAYANIHALNLAQSHPTFRSFLNNAFIVYCDGEGVRLGARMLGIKLPPRVVLTYWAWDLCALCEQNGFSVFFLGAHTDVVASAATKARSRFPRLRIVGTHQGYFAKEGPASEEVLRLINAARPDILFVGFGMPLQEEWIAANLERLTIHTVLPSGSLFDYMSGIKSFAPAWMANHGLEWLYRLIQEPGRLWKRYLIGNPVFFLRILGQRFTGGK
jgi:N-acetylglucosaminyldiphosphoundecaprenol N-acetyl-beta-D-mannosaminyltransferase